MNIFMIRIKELKPSANKKLAMAYPSMSPNISDRIQLAHWVLIPGQKRQSCQKSSSRFRCHLFFRELVERESRGISVPLNDLSVDGAEDTASGVVLS